MAKNRVHVDLVADDRDKEIDRLIDLGATRHDEHRAPPDRAIRALWRHRRCDTPAVASVADCRRVADTLIGQHIRRVLYVGLSYDSTDPDIVRWDYGDWHWPEAGVELSLSDGTKVHAIWDSQITHFELTLAIGPISDAWLPLQDDPPTARAWDVTHHPRWAPFIGSPVFGHDLALAAPDDPPVLAPVAVRLATVSSAVWLAAAAPSSYDAACEDLTAEDVYVGHNEVIVAFTDQRAQRIGLRLRP